MLGDKAGLGSIVDDPINIIDMMIVKRINRMWTAIVGKIAKVDMSARTVDVTPLIQEVYVNQHNMAELVTIPTLKDIPLFILTGGDYELTMPVKVGDECLVVFSSQCIDNWWKAGGLQAPFEYRKFDISDGFCLVGFYSQAVIQKNQLIDPIENGFELRRKDDTLKILMDDDDNISLIHKEQGTQGSIITELTIDKDKKMAYIVYDGENEKTHLTLDGDEYNLCFMDGGNEKASITSTINETTVNYDDGKINISLTAEGEISVSNEKSITITTKDEYSLDAEKAISVSTQDELSVESQKATSFSSQDSFDIEAQSDIGVTGQGAINIEATQDLSGKGQNVSFEAQQEASIGNSSNSMTIGMADIKIETSAGSITIGAADISIECGANSISVGPAMVTINNVLTVMP